jgi:hypothetical protein
MKANLKNDIGTEDTKRGSDLKLISDELKRQFDLKMRVDDSHNVKLSIILGFIMVIIVQITLTAEYATLVTAKPVTTVFFGLGFLSILCAFCIGIIAINPTNFGFGPNVLRLTEQWENKKEKDYTKNIFAIIWQDYKDAKQIVQNRGEFIQLMLALFSFGLVFIILSRIVPW